MLDGSAPRTRFSVTEVLFGLVERYGFTLPMLKLCQLITAFWLAWSTVTVLLVLAMLAEPAATVPSVGNA